MNCPAGQTCAQLPDSHGARAQSPSTLHTRPGAQPGQVPPPQSVSVSPPFRTPSEQLADWQTFDWQLPLWQSAPVLHPCPSEQGPHVAPPQFRPVSSPLRTASLQLGT